MYGTLLTTIVLPSGSSTVTQSDGSGMCKRCHSSAADASPSGAVTGNLGRSAMEDSPSGLALLSSSAEPGAP